MASKRKAEPAAPQPGKVPRMAGRTFDECAKETVTMATPVESSVQLVERLRNLCKNNLHQDLAEEIVSYERNAAVLKPRIGSILSPSINDEVDPESLAGRLLFDSCHYGHIECVKIVLPLVEESIIKSQYYHTPERSTHMAGLWTPLNVACFHGHMPIVSLLLSHCQGGVDEWSSCGDRTPLHYACDQGHLDVAKLLVSEGASITDKDVSYRTALDYAVQHDRVDCVHWLMDVMWKELDHDQATALIENSATKTYNRQMKTVMEGFLKLKSFLVSGAETPTMLVANISGPEGYGKTTFLDSYVTTDPVDQLARREQNMTAAPVGDESYYQQRTKGIATRDFINSHGHTIHIRDMAGQEQFCLAHDMFSLSGSTPSASFLFINAVDDDEKISATIYHTAGEVLSRRGRSPSSCSAHPVVLVASHGDVIAAKHGDVIAARHGENVARERKRQVLEIAKRAMAVFRKHLSLQYFVCLDTRDPASVDMNDFRTGFGRLASKILDEAPMQPTLLRHATRNLATVSAKLDAPFCTKAEFLSALCDLVQVKVPSDQEDFSNYLEILAAFGKVVTFQHGPLADTVVHRPSWLLQDVVGVVLSPELFPQPHLHFVDGRADVEEVIVVLNGVMKGNGALLMEMLLQLGIILRFNEVIICPSFLPAVPSPLEELSFTRSGSDVFCGLAFGCEESIPFSAASVIQTLTHVFDYVSHFQDETTVQLHKNAVTVCLVTGIRGTVVFAPTRLQCHIAASAPPTPPIQRREVMALVSLLQSIFQDVLSKHSPGTQVTETVVSPESIHQHVSSEGMSAIESYAVPAVRRRQRGNQLMYKRKVSDRALDTLHLPATHVYLLPADVSTELRELADKIPAKDFAAFLQVPVESAERVHGSSDLLVKWQYASHEQTTTELYRLLSVAGKHNAECATMARVLEAEEKELSQGFPDVFYNDEQSLSFLGQKPCTGELKRHLHHMAVSTDLIEDLVVTAAANVDPASRPADVPLLSAAEVAAKAAATFDPWTHPKFATDPFRRWILTLDTMTLRNDAISHGLLPDQLQIRSLQAERDPVAHNERLLDVLIAGGRESFTTFVKIISRVYPKKSEEFKTLLTPP